MYNAYQMLADVGDTVRALAETSESIVSIWALHPNASPLRRMAAWYEALALAGFTHTRPPFGIEEVEGFTGIHKVAERVALHTPFCDLVHFKRESHDDLPKVLLVAPMSGHFATLLRGTVRTLLGHHEVYVTDWLNPRDIKLQHGRFGLEDYTQHVIDFIQHIGPGCHVLAVCQPCVSALAATAVLAMDHAEIQPASLTLMAGPIDVRIAANKVNELATGKPLEWFRDNLIGTVPWKFDGGGRRVYPGFLQLIAFISMNSERHTRAFFDMYNARVEGDDQKADQIKDFYKEYFAVMDLTADFYLETLDQVFQRFLLPKGEMMFKGRRIDLGAIKHTFLLTVEGEKDDICSVGQTLAAQDLCTGLRPYMKTQHLQAGVGHYGVFNGKKWDAQIYPVVRNHIQASSFS
ncbi:MAG: polyhydroxyalkanoate depolymerase [Roseiarcus sp.]